MENCIIISDRKVEWGPINAKISASSSQNGKRPSNLMLPNSAPWQSTVTNGVYQWLKFSFSRLVTISGFQTKAPFGVPGSAFKNFVFDRSDDGFSWTPVINGQGIDQACCEWEQYQFPEVTARYFRLYLIDNYGHDTIAMDEIQFRFTKKGTFLVRLRWSN